MDARRIALACAWIGALFFAVIGVWAFVAPHSFFTTVARVSSDSPTPKSRTTKVGSP